MLKTFPVQANYLNEQVKIVICSEILSDHDLKYFIDKRLYSIFENKINQFTDYLKNYDQSIEIELVFENWVNSNKQNYSFKGQKSLFLKRVENQERTIASEN